MGNQILCNELLPFLANEKDRKALRFHGFPVSKVRPYFTSSQFLEFRQLQSVTRQFLIMGDKNHQGNKTHLLEMLNRACHKQKTHRRNLSSHCRKLPEFAANLGFLCNVIINRHAVYLHWSFKQHIIFLN